MGMVVRTCGRSRGRKIDTERRMLYGILDDGSVEVVAEGERVDVHPVKLEHFGPPIS